MTGKPSIAIIGLGLIGGSIARRLSARGWYVGWIDPDLDERVVGEVEPRLQRLEAVRIPDLDLALLSTPTGVAIDALGELDFGSAAVTSVCSVMRPLVEIASKRSVRFVAGHPMAGREVGGWSNAQPDLFEGRPWFVGKGADAESSNAALLVERMIEDCGADPIPIDPGEHDRFAALASHLPQLLSTALAAVVAESDVPEAFRGPGLRTFLRLAGSSWSMWEPVFEWNAEAIHDSRRLLDEVIRQIEQGDGEAAFERANELYEAMRNDE